jgi:hypothetical protein
VEHLLAVSSFDCYTPHPWQFHVSDKGIGSSEGEMDEEEKEHRTKAAKLNTRNVHREAQDAPGRTGMKAYGAATQQDMDEYLKKMKIKQGHVKVCSPFSL